MKNLAEIPLSTEHLEMLHRSAISDEVILARGYRTITNAEVLRQMGFAAGQCNVPGLLLPLWTTDGQNGAHVYRPDNPRVVEDKSKGRQPDGIYPNKVIKYEYIKGRGMRLDCPPMVQLQLGDPAIPLWITEGQKKGDALASLGLCAIALLGIWNWRGKNELGGSTVLADWEHIALRGREVRIVFDSDLRSNPHVQAALNRLTGWLGSKGAYVRAVYLPAVLGLEKTGVDDWLAAGHGREELEALIEMPRPEPQPIPAVAELLDEAPLLMTRPLMLLNGRGFAAAWPWVKLTATETANKNKEVLKLAQPIVTKEQRTVILRDDGVLFGDGGDSPLTDLEINVHLPEVPANESTWSTKGLKAYRAGNRHDPAIVFNKVADVVDAFMDFDRSLADQRTMCEAVACYILSTYLMDAFQVTGFLWPNGLAGSGKTNLLIVVAKLAYLGELITAGGTFASLRDMADYGATLAFDDAENLTDPKKTDPDKRTLLLAGNRRGITVPLKEITSDGKSWRTRRVNAFCPRLFSAIRLPDGVLESRCIVIPLVRTSDKAKANIDPLDYSKWPHDRRQLIDDLWALGLAHIHELGEWDDYAAQNTNLAGRNLEPWRAILAVAAWLDAKGVAGLYERISNLTMDYQTERPDLSIADYTGLTIQALLELAVTNLTNVANVTNLYWEWETAKIAETAKLLAAELEEGGIDPEKVNSQRLGHVLRKMRLTKPPRERGQKARIWRVTLAELFRMAGAYGILFPDELQRKMAESQGLINENENSDPSPNIGDTGDIGNIGDVSEMSGEDVITGIEDEDVRHAERIRQAQEYIDDWNSG